MKTLLLTSIAFAALNASGSALAADSRAANSVMKSRRSLPVFARNVRLSLYVDGGSVRLRWSGRAPSMDGKHLPRPGELTPPLATIRAAFGVGR
jgi:hypothetical protein